jgi:hypothetical protein
MLEHEINGEAFLDLSEADIKSIVLKVGLVKKVLGVQKALCLHPEAAAEKVTTAACRCAFTH